MLELKLTCQSHDEARVYLNAHQYLNLLSDFAEAASNAQKHGTDGDVVKVVENFLTDFYKAIDNSMGAY